MKWSLYNYFIDNNDDYFILYNCRYDKILGLTKDLKLVIEKEKENIDNLRVIHPDLYKSLELNRYIVDSDLDEGTETMKYINQKENNEECFSLIINPTLGCNLNCWYCYETHLQNTHMSIEIQQSVCKLIKNRVGSGKYKSMDLSFFGGEPFLEYESIVLPLIQYANNICLKNNITLLISFTSNGILFTPEVVDRLLFFKREISLQIPFDGGRTHHNLTKKCINSDVSAYDVVINNIKYALSKGIDITIRCNYTPKNIDSFKELIEDFQGLRKESKKYLSFMFKRIWQIESNQEIENKISKLCEFTSETGLNDVSSFEKGGLYCYADTPASVVVNYNGDIFKCTSRDFVREAREGILDPDGNIRFNERYEDRMKCKALNTACINCKVLPICLGGCTQHHLELFEENVCPISFDEIKKYQLAKKRLTVITKKD